MIRSIMANPAISKHVQEEYEPGLAYTGDKLREEALRRVTTVYHPVGTCRMGVDEHAVVGPDLKVRGVDSLPGAAASIMPRHSGGQTNHPQKLKSRHRVVSGQRMSNNVKP